MATKAETKKNIQMHYTGFVKDGLTVSAACKQAEDRIAMHEQKAEFYRKVRNDISAHAVSARAKFDPSKHTHGFANL